MRVRRVTIRFCGTAECVTKNLVDSPAGICTERAQEKNSRLRKALTTEGTGFTGQACLSGGVRIFQEVDLEDGMRGVIRKSVVVAFVVSLFVLALHLFVGNLYAQVQPKRVLLKCGSLFDGKSDSVRKNVTLLVEGETIKEVGTAAAGADVIDLSSRTCLPGLIDTHTHVLLQGDITAEDYDVQLLKQSPEYRTILGTVNARRALEYGFTTIRDLETEGAGYADVDNKKCHQQWSDSRPADGCGYAGARCDWGLSAAGVCAQCAGATRRAGR